MTGLWIALVALSIVLLILFKRCTTMHSLIETSSRETVEIRRMLSFVEMVPLVTPARRIHYALGRVEEDWENVRSIYLDLEQKEFEAFSAKNPSPDQPFVPSETLTFWLKKWAEQSYLLGVAGQWVDVWQQKFADVLTGRLPVKEAEQSLPTIIPLDVDEAQVQAIMKQWAGRWAAGKWQERLPLNGMEDNSPATGVCFRTAG